MIHDYKFIEKENKYGYDYPRAANVADAVVFRFDGERLYLLLIRRKNNPYMGSLAFPGGFMDMDETTEECCRRELEEETGIRDAYLRQVGMVGTVNRDPRGRVLTTVYYALVPNDVVVRAGDDAAQVAWYPVDEVLREVEATRVVDDGMVHMRQSEELKPYLAFDHGMILRAALQRLKEDLHFRPIAFQLLPEEFTMAQLHRLYQQVLGVKFDYRNFKRKMLMTGILQPLNRTEESHTHHSGWLYRYNNEAYVRMKRETPLATEF